MHARRPRVAERVRQLAAMVVKTRPQHIAHEAHIGAVVKHPAAAVDDLKAHQMAVGDVQQPPHRLRGTQRAVGLIRVRGVAWCATARY